jgi:hypothetical protein
MYAYLILTRHQLHQPSADHVPPPVLRFSCLAVSLVVIQELCALFLSDSVLSLLCTAPATRSPAKSLSSAPVSGR